MAGTSTLTGSGWLAYGQPRTDDKPYGIPVYPGQPQQGVGSPGDLTIDLVGRKIYENVAGTWNAGTTF